MTNLGSATVDCFRTGSIVQLKSKVNNKTLAVRYGGTVTANGTIGYYAGHVGPQTKVWGRWTNGNYYHGTVSSVDFRVQVQFDDGDQISHDISDVSAVLPDVDPDPEVLQRGTRVIASYSTRAMYFVGRIIDVNRSDPKKPFCHVLFDDGDKQWNPAFHIRVLPVTPHLTGSGATPIVPRSRVLGRWTNNLYYKGHVTNIGQKIDIQFDDGDRVSHDPSDVSAVINDVNPYPGDIQISTRVVALWPKNNKFYPGRVTQVDHMSNTQQPRYFVQFDDGDRTWSTVNEIRRIPSSHFQVGCAVWGRWTNNLYYHGMVAGFSDGKIHVQFDDGDRISHSVSDVKAVLSDVVPNPQQIPVGCRVIAAFSNRVQYYQGCVEQVEWTNSKVPQHLVNDGDDENDVDDNDGSDDDGDDDIDEDGDSDDDDDDDFDRMNPQVSRYFIHYDDGDKGWVNCHQVRVFPQRTDQVGTRVWGRWTNGLYYRGTVECVDSRIHIKFDDGDIICHDVDNEPAVILDVQPTRSALRKGTRVIASWPNRAMYYPGTVGHVNTSDPHSVQYFVKYDDGNRGYVTINQLRILPSRGSAREAQFRVTYIGGNVVSLACVACPDLYLGVDGGWIRGKSLDNYCHFYVHETPDHYVTLESCMLPGQHVGVNPNGTVAPPRATNKSEPAFFEVKLLFSPYGQKYVAHHSTSGPCYPGTSYGQYTTWCTPPIGYYTPLPQYPAPPGQYPPPPAWYPVGTHLPPPGQCRQPVEQYSLPPGQLQIPGYFPPPAGYQIIAYPPLLWGYPYGHAAPPCK